MQITDVKKEIQTNFPKFKENLKTLVSYNSKNMPADGDAPFGKNLLNVLEKALEIASSMGLKTFIDPKGYYGYAEIGEGTEMLGVLGHLDVVPADDTENWDTDPFTMTEKDGYLIGRGTQDDKGPTLASLYAMKILIDNGAKFNKRVRFIFCTDEESLWRCIKAYAENEEHPTMGFTPDSHFPLVYAEKGLVEYTLIAEENIDYEFTGGSALNAVPAKSTIKSTDEIKSALDSLEYKYEEDQGELTVIGKTVHAMIPDEGINSITRLLEALSKAGKKGKIIDFVLQEGLDPFGKPIFGNISDYTGGLSFNIGLADFKKDKQTLGIDIRFPATKKKEDIDKMMSEAAAKYDIKVEPFDYLRPLYIDPESELAVKLLKAYRDVTGDTQSKPITLGGATFARSMDNIVAFGANFPDSVVTEHGPNERIKESDLKKAMEVYVAAFINLAVDD